MSKLHTTPQKQNQMEMKPTSAVRPSTEIIGDLYFLFFIHLGFLKHMLLV